MERNTIARQVWMFMFDYSYNETMIAGELDCSPQTVSRGISLNCFTFDQIRALKRLFKKYDEELVGEVKQKVDIVWIKEK